MERLILSGQEFIVKKGVSLKDLVGEIPVKNKGRPPKRMGKVLWLSNAIETTPFWDSLNKHLLKDTKKRHSTGGLFYRESGDENIGEYTWYEIYSSLDDFLQKFGSKATEFIFRDFAPKNSNAVLESRIKTVRETALEKFPRLRKLYWEDYKEGLETIAFWEGLNRDLQRLKTPISINSFFSNKKVIDKEIDIENEASNVGNNLERNMLNRFTHQTGNIEKRAQFLDYQNLAQIINDLFSQDPRSFLLRYETKSTIPYFQQLIFNTKRLIEQKILPLQPAKEKLKKITFKDVEKIVSTESFWQNLLKDLNEHTKSKQPVYNFFFFLRNYDRNENEVMPNRIGSYAELCTAFTKKKKGIAKELIKDTSKELVNYLMWGFKPTSELEKTVTGVKRLAAELFPQDCLYVELQDPEFWKRFEKDILKIKRPMSLGSFLRYFNDENINADRRMHKPNTAPYQRFLHRSYHKPQDLKALCKYLKLPITDNYKTNLQTLFFHLSPDNLKDLLRTKFPVDFNVDAKDKKAKEIVIFDRAKNYLKTLIENSDKPLIIPFSSVEELNEFRKKKLISRAARSSKKYIRTSVGENNTLIVELKEKKKLNKADVIEIEKKVKELRDQKLTNKQIAEELGLEKDYNAEYIAGKLIKKGEIRPRVKTFKNIL